MSSRKKLKNRETFHFDENDVLPATPVPVLHKKKSVQGRLAPKAGNLSHYGVGAGIPPRARAAGHQSSPTLGPLAPVSSRPVTGQPPASLLTLNNNTRYQPAAKPGTAIPKPQTSSDPVLDRIVRQLKAGLSLSESGSSLGEVARGGGGDCLCERSTKLILCQLCGATYPGRTALKCSLHPRKIFLQDLQRCRECQAGTLEDLKEFELPPGMKETLGKVRKM